MKKKFMITLSFVLFSLHASEQVEITNSKIRLVPPTSTATAVYLDIKNTTDSDIQITGISSQTFPEMELHEMAMENNMMKMRKVEFVLVKAKSTTQLKPGGLHGMILNLKKPLVKDEEFEFTLIDLAKKQYKFKAKVTGF